MPDGSDAAARRQKIYAGEYYPKMGKYKRMKSRICRRLLRS